MVRVRVRVRGGGLRLTPEGVSEVYEIPRTLAGRWIHFHEVKGGGTVGIDDRTFSHLPSRRDCAAESSATIAEEHAVLIVKQGPFSPRRYEIRPAAPAASPPRFV